MKHSSSKKFLLDEKLPKPPKGASKLTSFRAILAVRTHNAVRAQGLLAPSSSRFFFMRRGLFKRSHIFAQLPAHCQQQHCPSVQLMGSRDSTDSSSRSAEHEWRGQSYMKVNIASTSTCRRMLKHRRSARPPNVGLTSTLPLVLVLIRIRVPMMVFVFFLLVWTRRLRPIFPLSQVELCLAVRARWLTAANFDRRSHCSGTTPIF